MKKPTIITATLLISAVCALCACGTKYATVDGIEMTLTQDGGYIYSSGDSSGCVLLTGDEFDLSVNYAQHGGSIVAVVLADSVTINYDSSAIQLTLVSEGGYDPVYSLVAVTPVNNTVITVTDGEYSAVMTLSFVNSFD